MSRAELLKCEEGFLVRDGTVRIKPAHMSSPALFCNRVRWIIKRKENAINHLNIANEARKMPNLHSNYFMVYVEHRKKSSANNEDMTTISQNLSCSLSKPRNFIGDGSICEDSTWQQSPNHLKFLPLHYEVKSWHHAKFQLFLSYFTFSKISKTKKSIKIT